MERTCSFFYVMLYLLFYFEAEKVKKDVKTSINLIKMCYETCFFSWKVCQCPKSPYICNVFFIVLDLRLTKVGVQRYSFFYTHTFRYYSFPSLHHTNSVSSPYQVRTKSKCIDMELIRSRQGFDYIQRIKSKWPLRSCILST